MLDGSLMGLGAVLAVKIEGDLSVSRGHGAAGHARNGRGAAFWVRHIKEPRSRGGPRGGHGSENLRVDIGDFAGNLERQVGQHGGLGGGRQVG